MSSNRLESGPRLKKAASIVIDRGPLKDKLFLDALMLVDEWKKRDSEKFPFSFAIGLTYNLDNLYNITDESLTEDLERTVVILGIVWTRLDKDIQGKVREEIKNFDADSLQKALLTESDEEAEDARDAALGFLDQLSLLQQKNA